MINGMYIPKYNAFFIHIPKTGGTSIEFYLLRDMGVTVSTDNSDEVFYNHRDLYLGAKWREVPLKHYTTQQLQDHDKFINSDYRFTIVRHPVERFLSEYVWRKEIELKQGIQNGTSMSQMLDDLKKPEVRDYRLRSYWQYCAVNNELDIDDIFRLEDIPHMQRTLSDRLGKPFVMPHDNKSAVEKPVLTKSQIDIIRSAWAKDFEVFNYD